MLADGQRFGQRGEVGVQPVGHGEEQQLLEHQVLGQRARIVVGVADLLDARRSEQNRHRADAGAHGQGAGGVGPVLDDLRAELVAEDAVGRRVERRHADRVHERGEVGEVAQRVQIGPADAGGERAHHDVARGGDGVGHLAHHQPALPGHRGSHATPPTLGRRVPPRRRRRSAGRVSHRHPGCAQCPRGARVERRRRTGNGVAMPILSPEHDLAHPVEGDSAWSESWYFNAYDPATDSGFFTRVGVRPNEGTMDVGMSVWLPGGELGEYRSVKEQRTMVDSVLEVGDVRYEMLEPTRAWRLTMDGTVAARPCRRGEDTTHPVAVALDVRFDAVTPAIGTDGQPSGGPKSAEAAAAAGTVGKGHLEQAGRWTGTLSVDGTVHEWQGAHGNRDRSWGPRRWGGPKMWRWFSINVGEDTHFGGIRLGHRGRRPPPGLGLGRHRGHLGGRVARRHRAGRRRGDAPGRPPRGGRQGGSHPPPAGRRPAGGRHRAGRRHHGQRGPGPLDLRRRRRRRPAPGTASASTCTNSTRPGGRSSRSSSDAPVTDPRRSEELAGALGRRLGGTRARPAAGSPGERRG